MDRPLTSSKLLLVADHRMGTARPTATPIRRYRLARLQLDGRPARPAMPFEHLKRVFD
jgi:hypothetical protein